MPIEQGGKTNLPLLSVVVLKSLSTIIDFSSTKCHRCRRLSVEMALVSKVKSKCRKINTKMIENINVTFSIYLRNPIS